jgi:hypothetical protein
MYIYTGAKFRDDIYTAFENIYPILQSFRKGDAANPAPAPLMPPPPASAMIGTNNRLLCGKEMPLRT